MPYIKQKDRRSYAGLTNQFRDFIDSTTPSGDLNYLITKLLLTTLPQKYNDFNTLLGILDAVARELYRRKIAPYEDQKIKENGDVY